MNSSEPVYNRDKLNETQEIPVTFMGITGKPLKENQNPFRKKKVPQLLLKGGLYLISDYSLEEFEGYLKQTMHNLVEQYEKLPYTEHIRTLYKKRFGKHGNSLDVGMIIHFWVHKYKGLEYTLWEYKKAGVAVGIIHGKDAPVHKEELLQRAFMQIPQNHPIIKAVTGNGKTEKE